MGSRMWGGRRVVAATSVAIALVVGTAAPAYSNPGQFSWAKRFDGPAHDYDQPKAIATSPDGTKVFVTGYSNDASTNPDYETIAYNTANGSVVWKQRYRGPTGIENDAYAIGVSPDGSKVFVTGGSIGSSTRDYATIAYNAGTGAVVWTKRYNGSPGADDYATALAVSPDGATVFVTGNSSNAQATYDYATVAYNASTGAVRWTKRYSGGGRDNTATALAVSPDGTKVIVTGYGDQPNTQIDYETVAYNAVTGAPLWSATYNGPANFDDTASAVAVSPDGTRVIVTGSSLESPPTYDYATVAYDATTGAARWTRRFNGAANGDDMAAGLAVAPDGSNVFVTGTSAGTTGDDFMTIAYSVATGNIGWTRRFNGPASGEDRAAAIAVSPDGANVVVAGSSLGATTSFDFATVAYAAGTGSPRWSRRYDGPAHGDDDASALAISPDSTKVFVTGDSSTTDGAPDYATVSYQLT